MIVIYFLNWPNKNRKQNITFLLTFLLSTSLIFVKVESNALGEPPVLKKRHFICIPLMDFEAHQVPFLSAVMMLDPRTSPLEIGGTTKPYSVIEHISCPYPGRRRSSLSLSCPTTKDCILAGSIISTLLRPLHIRISL